MDYEAAFQRERKARKQAESILEQKSRELHFANSALKENVESLHFAVEKNKFLIHIGDYGINRPKLRDFLPILLKNMMSLSNMAFSAFIHFPFNSQQSHFLSPIYRKPSAESDEQNELSIPDGDLKNIIWEIEALIREEKILLTKNIKIAIDNQDIDTVIAIPIISLEHLSGILILFNNGITQTQAQLLKVFESGTKQLAIIMEHRYQDDKLLESYNEISKTNQALKEAQKQLVQSEKMATVGQLSAGIAHEINNPMGFIKSNINSLSNYLDDFIRYIKVTQSLSYQDHQPNDELINIIKKLEEIWQDVDMNFLLGDTKQLLEESQQGIKRIIDIVGGLKRFSRQSDDQKEPCDIVLIIEEALKLASNELKYKGNISKEFQTVQLIQGNSGELLQVFLNLFVNAAHAMDEQGELHIRINDAQTGVKISITDNGCGIDEVHLESIFTPFFTTKEVGIGTGLGLSISYGIIENHQGSIEVTSKVGNGTSFNIFLPYTTKKVNLNSTEKAE
ncbi:ATP-binding protein [Marinomonas sp. THO17]|uniref:sensor histidine kinase n=1 Tax=Marinomonas sp. THO17 TaxID=3149048 RepID=UPI00336BE585